jgi:hypothetical protein
MLISASFGPVTSSDKVSVNSRQEGPRMIYQYWFETSCIVSYAQQEQPQVTSSQEYGGRSQKHKRIRAEQPPPSPPPSLELRRGKTRMTM